MRGANPTGIASRAPSFLIMSYRPTLEQKSHLRTAKLFLYARFYLCTYDKGEDNS